MEVAVGLAYPIADLILLGMIVGALAGTGWQLDRTWLLLFLGVAVFWLADSLYLVGNANGTYTPGSWFDSGWWIGMVLIAGAAWQPMRPALQEAADERLRRIVVPLCFGAAGLALLVYGCVADVNLVAVGLAAASLLAVMARTMLTFRDNVAMLRTSREEAQTDALTGLGNRRALARVLERELPRATEQSPLVLVLFDLDGFKHYNDTFGHPAGDSLLVRLGGSLASFVQERGGRAFRMGGDEFCALFAPGAQLPDGLVLGAAAALSEHGEGFSIGCSYGAIELPREAADVAEALRIADQRMYAQKNAGRTSASRQSKDVLLRALAERDPGLRDRASGLGELAEATALRLSISHEIVEQVRHAAELHDVGKVAVPDAILEKPGPLDRRRVGVHPAPHADRRAHHRRGARAHARRRARAREPRALGRHGLSRRARRRGDPARGPHRRRGRRLRRDDAPAPVRDRVRAGARGRGAPPLRRHAVRPGGRRRLRRGVPGPLARRRRMTF